MQNILRERNLLTNIEVQRVTFTEITQAAVTAAIAAPREISQSMVQAYLARRALDYLVGFTLSPLLWRKLPGSKSAGRVQSVALRMLCEREAAIEAFTAREYWSVEAELHEPKGVRFDAKLTHLDGQKLDKFDLPSEVAAAAAVATVRTAELSITAISKSRSKRHPTPPFTTSTLQQAASSRLGFGAQQTMSIAQRLYEGVEGSDGGLITYMRTDGVSMAASAVDAGSGGFCHLMCEMNICYVKSATDL